MLTKRNPVTEIKNKLYQQTFNEGHSSKGLSATNSAVFILILLGIFISILETENSISPALQDWLKRAEFLIAVLFAGEYLVRLLVVDSDPKYKGFTGRLRYMCTPLAVIDLLAFLPSLLTLGASDSLLLRIARLARLARFATLGRYTGALNLIRDTLFECWRELVVSIAIAIVLLIVSASILYMVEADIQPEQFGSIPRALWWSVATLTTVGYGDVYPITAMGKLCAGSIAIIGIGLVSMPTAILAGSFSDQFKAARQRKKAELKKLIKPDLKRSAR